MDTNKNFLDNIEEMIKRRIASYLEGQNLYRTYKANVLAVKSIDKNLEESAYNQKCDLNLIITNVENVINKSGELLKTGDCVIVQELIGSNFSDCYISSKDNTYIQDQEDSVYKTVNEYWIEDSDGFIVSPNHEPNTICFLSSDIFSMPEQYPFSISFDWKVSSEPNFDVLGFRLFKQNINPIDTGSIPLYSQEISGEVAETTYGFNLGSGGNFLLQFYYRKDSSTDIGNDCGGVKNVATTSGPIPLKPYYEYTGG